MDRDTLPAKTELQTPPPQSLKHHHPPPPPPAYKECMKNHAVNIGGHAVDGCGEYMPAPPSAATLTCAACGCHRNFHRRDFPTAAITPPFLDFRRPAEPVTPIVENPLLRKRFRTRFSQEQKEKMQSFSEKIGWKMQKSDAAATEEFCREVGVGRGVLKVWMHNNKNTIGKREMGGCGNGGVVIGFEKSGGGGGGGGDEETRKSDDGDSDGGGLHFHDSNNGSCSSSH